MELFGIIKLAVPIVFGTILVIIGVSFILYKANKKEIEYAPLEEGKVSITYNNPNCIAGGCRLFSEGYCYKEQCANYKTTIQNQ